MFKKALLPVTLRERKQDLESYLTLMASWETKEVHLCHVIDSGFARYEQLSKRLKEFKKWIADNFPQIQVSSEITSGHAGSELIASAKKAETSFIYLPASRRHRLGKLLIGSTASDVVRLTDLPVFVHKNRPEIITTDNQDYKPAQNSKIFQEVLLAVDFGPNTDRTCSSLEEIGSSIETITFLHIGKRAGDPYSEASRRERVKVKLQELTQKFNCDCREIKTKDRIGIPSKEILQEESNRKTDLIILGKLKVKMPGNLILGSTAERVLKGARASILIVP